MELINHYIDVLSHIENGAAIGTVSIVIEFLLRLIPTDKPRSILYIVSGVVHGIGKTFTILGDILDKVIPQKTK